jgi:hypothetical protein
MSFVKAGILWLLACAVLCGQETRPKVLLESKVDNDGDFLVLPVEIEGKEALFFVDTAARTTMLDATVREELTSRGMNFVLAEEEFEHTSAIAERSRAIVPPRMNVKGTHAGNIPFPMGRAVKCVDLTLMRSLSKHHIQGILGMDFLEAYALDLDVASGSLKLFDSSTLTSPKLDGEIKLTMKSRMPYVPIVVANEKCDAVLSTGSLMTLRLNGALFKQLVKSDDIACLEIANLGRKSAHLGWLKELQLGPFSHKALYAQPKDDAPNLLGLEYWRRYHCVFDFPREVAYFEKGKFFDAVDDGDHAGIHVKKVVGEAPVVQYVVKGSASDNAGVRTGDRLVSIDGRDLRLIGQPQMRRFLCFRHERTCELVLNREGEEIHVKLPPSQGDKQ